MSHPFTPRHAAAAVLVLTVLAGCGVRPLADAPSGEDTLPTAAVAPASAPPRPTDAPAPVLPPLDDVDPAAGDAMNASTSSLVHEMPTGGALPAKGATP